MKSLSAGIALAQKGPFAGHAFYVEPNLDVLNRVQFRVITWHGKSDEDGGGGWWHFDSIVHDREAITLYTEVTETGAEGHSVVRWTSLDDERDEERQEQLADEDQAWKWVSAELIEPLGLETVEGASIPDSDTEEFREVADANGYAKLVDE
jgi:hypothetical protein